MVFGLRSGGNKAIMRLSNKHQTRAEQIYHDGELIPLQNAVHHTIECEYRYWREQQRQQNITIMDGGWSERQATCNQGDITHKYTVQREIGSSFC